jgi:hypothetical protein
MKYLNLFIHPTRFFKIIKEQEKISFIIPIIIFVIIAILTGFTAGKTITTMGLPDDQMGAIKAAAIGMGIFSTLIGLAIGLFIKAGIFHFVLKKMKGIANFKSCVYVIGISFFPKIFQGILNLVFFKPINMDAIYEFDMLTVLSNSLNVFNLWQIALTIVGLSIMYEISYRKTAILVIGFEVVAAGFSIATTLLTAGAMPKI